MVLCYRSPITLYCTSLYQYVSYIYTVLYVFDFKIVCGMYVMDWWAVSGIQTNIHFAQYRSTSICKQNYRITVSSYNYHHTIIPSYAKKSTVPLSFKLYIYNVTNNKSIHVYVYEYMLITSTVHISIYCIALFSCKEILTLI